MRFFYNEDYKYNTWRKDSDVILDMVPKVLSIIPCTWLILTSFHPSIKLYEYKKTKIEISHEDI